MKKINNVLLIDDDEIANYMNKLIIEEVNISENIHMAQNGEEALNFIKENCAASKLRKGTCPALIFLDINMPVMDGFEFLEALENLEDFDPENVPVIVLTSSSNINDVAKAKNYKIYGYVPKPLTEEKVKAIAKEIRGVYYSFFDL